MKNLKNYGFNTKNKVYVIAEIGMNHGGSIKTAKKLIDSAVRAGADAVKFQTYITEKRADGKSPIFDILKKCELPFKTFNELKQYARMKKIDFFSTPFDEDSLDYLESIDVNMYKIASFDVTNHAFLKKVSTTKKPVVLSVGMANLPEIKRAYSILCKNTKKITLLHCVSSYPTKEKDANLSAICELKDEFDCVIGQSDHTDDITIPLYAIAAGAQVIEKHFKISEAMRCVDAPVSITERQMKRLVSEARRLECILGAGVLGVNKAQKPALIFRRYSNI